MPAGADAGTLLNGRAVNYEANLSHPAQLERMTGTGFHQVSIVFPETPSESGR